MTEIMPFPENNIILFYWTAPPGRPLSSSFFFQQLRVAAAVLDAAGDTAEGGRGDIRLGHDLGICIAVQEQLRRVDPLGHVGDLLAGAQVVEEGADILRVGDLGDQLIEGVFFLMGGHGDHSCQKVS